MTTEIKVLASVKNYILQTSGLVYKDVDLTIKAPGFQANTVSFVFN